MLDYTTLKPLSCAACTLYKAPGPCWGEGDYEHARLAYIAQNPGTHEVDRQPFTPLRGPSGNVFNRQLAETHIERRELFVTNQVKCLTPGNREPTPHEIRCCKPLLDQELRRVRADTVVLAGATAFSANIGRYSTLSPHYHPSESIFERMGCVEQRDGRKWIGTIHPAFIMRMVDFRDEGILHLRKAYAVAGVDIPLPRVIVDPTSEDIERHRKAARTGGLFADDVEAINMPKGVAEDDYIGADWSPDLLGLSAIANEALVFKWERAAAAWRDIWADRSIMQAEHNGEYDRYHIENIAGELALDRRYEGVGCRRFDTMLAHHWLHNNIYKYLKPECLRYYTYLPYYNRDLEGVSRTLYAGLDNVTTFLVARVQINELKREGLWELFWQLGQPILPILEEQRRVGANVDLRKAFLYKRITEEKVAAAEKLITKMTGPFFNWKSWQQKAALWYDKWGLPKIYKKGKDGKDHITTDDDARVKLRRWIAANNERQVRFKQAAIFFDLLDYVSENKKLNEYFDRISPDGRIHAHWKAHGTETFRLASVPNFQNWPTWAIADGYDSVRAIVIPDHEDDELLSTDFDQIELWTYAQQFDIRWLKEIYAKGEYIYGAAYEEVFKRPFFQAGKPRTKKYRLDSVTDEELLRAKAVPLGFLYARAGESVAAEHGWPPSEGAQLRASYFRRVPELPRAHEKIQYEMRQKRRLRPPPGLLLHYPQPKLQGLNCFGQTPAAMMLFRSMIMIDREFKRRGWKNTRIVLTVHDSILFNIAGARREPARMVEVYEEIINPILTAPVPWFDGFSYRHAAKVGGMWDWKMIDYPDWKMATNNGTRRMEQAS